MVGGSEVTDPQRMTDEEVEQYAEWAWKRIRGSIDDDAIYSGFNEVAAHTRDAIRQMVRGISERDPGKYDALFNRNSYDIVVRPNPYFPDGYIAVIEHAPNGTPQMVGMRLPDGTVVRFDPVRGWEKAE